MSFLFFQLEEAPEESITELTPYDLLRLREAARLDREIRAARPAAVLSHGGLRDGSSGHWNRVRTKRQIIGDAQNWMK